MSRRKTHIHFPLPFRTKWSHTNYGQSQNLLISDLKGLTTQLRVTKDFYQVILKTEPKFSYNQIIKRAHVLCGSMEDPEIIQILWKVQREHFTVVNQLSLIRNTVTWDLNRKVSGGVRLAITQLQLSFVYSSSLLHVRCVGDGGSTDTKVEVRRQYWMFFYITLLFLWFWDSVSHWTYCKTSWPESPRDLLVSAFTGLEL